MNEPGNKDLLQACQRVNTELRRQVRFLEQAARDLTAELEAKASELAAVNTAQRHLDKRALVQIGRGIRLAVRRPKDFLCELIFLITELLASQPPGRNDTTAGSQKAPEAALDRWLEEGGALSTKGGLMPAGGTALLLVSHEASRTGAPKALLELARAMKATRAVRVFFVFISGGGMLGEFQALGPCLVLNERGASLRKSIRQLSHRFGQLPGPKKALANTIMSRIFLEPLQQAGIPAVCWVHDSVRCILDHCKGQSTMTKLQRVAQRIVYSSPANRDAARRAFGLAENKTAVVRYGLRPLENFNRSALRAEIFLRLGLDERELLILGCGTMQSRKGVDLFVRAALYVLHLCAEDGPWPHFLWLGAELDPTFAASVHALRRVDAFGSHIHFLKEQPDPQKYFAACDLFILASRDDPYPFVTLEALAWARPVLAFANATGQEELFAGCEELLMQDMSVGGMGEKILDFIHNRAQYEESTRRAAANATALLNWQDSADAFAALLDIDLMSSQAAPETK